MKLPLMIVADDLTGANDSSVMFAEAGFSTMLAMSPATLQQAFSAMGDVFAVSTDSRASPDANRLTAYAIQTAMAYDIGHLYLKIDSTMRGSVHAQVQGALQAWQQRHPDAVVVVCPAYPAMGRTVEQGQLLVNGIPVHETPSGKDAICPVPSADMKTLLPDAFALPCAPAKTLAENIRSANAPCVVVDAKSDDDLAQIAEAIAILGNRAIPAGSAGLARAMVKTLPPPASRQHPLPLPVTDPVLVLVTSIHDTSQQQIDTYIATSGARATVFSPHPAQLQADEAFPALQAQISALLAAHADTIIIRANPAKLASPQDAPRLAKTFAHKLAALGKCCLEQRRFGALLLIGGDGSAALMETLGVESIRVLCPVAEGVPLATIHGTAWNGLPVITKSGGFGQPDLLCQIMSQLTQENL